MIHEFPEKLAPLSLPFCLVTENRIEGYVAHILVIGTAINVMRRTSSSVLLIVR